MRRQCLQEGLIRAKTVSSWALAKFSLKEKKLTFLASLYLNYSEQL
ncbi:hypothetical protein DSOL_0690 [Desulfosporosinus metallidurans]|uniref:Uncharacterized protein n=1 Tax=Desulfosporosinus metallidurans TaxID=1888891 RepID=A0A1Q8R1J3_9FIRM|nr:hypothetical protein DSOL_0690 [Desulfosporosinus metallidurans]